MRWHIGALLAPVISLTALVIATLGGWMASNNHMDHAIYLQPAQWIALIGVPLVTLALDALADQRREHSLTMVEFGRAADRQHPKE